MYLVGEEHPNKQIAQGLLEECIAERRRMVTDTEVFQEILHRYTAINRRSAIQDAFDVLNGIVDEVFPVDFADIEGAKSLVFEHQYLSARDALHLAVMRRYKVSSILTFGRGFDQVLGMIRTPSA